LPIVVHSLRAKALLGLSGLLLVSCIVLLVLLLDRQAEVDSSGLGQFRRQPAVMMI
jgi:hypothetical protein